MPDFGYASILAASFTGNDVLLLLKDSVEFVVCRLSQVAAPAKFPYKNEEQSLFVSEQPELLVSDCISFLNFAADGTLKRTIDLRVI